MRELTFRQIDRLVAIEVLDYKPSPSGGWKPKHYSTNLGQAQEVIKNIIARGWKITCTLNEFCTEVTIITAKGGIYSRYKNEPCIKALAMFVCLVAIESIGKLE